MSKDKLLTKDEFSDYKPENRIIQQIHQCCKEFNLPPDKLNILDWGCGRGKDVLWLRERGYNAFGVDLDSTPVENAYSLFDKKGFSTNILRLLNDDGTSNFDDSFFHFVFSSQVFEHVENLNAVAAEMNRIMVENGMGLHIFPSHKHIIERHLYLPFIHWLPKTRIRRAAISMFVSLGIEPNWPKLDQSSKEEKIEMYFRYSVEKTYYRKPSQIRKIFNQHNFDLIFDTINNPSIKKWTLFMVLTKNKYLRKLLNYLLFTFIRVELKLKKRL